MYAVGAFGKLMKDEKRLVKVNILID